MPCTSCSALSIISSNSAIDIKSVVLSIVGISPLCCVATTLSSPILAVMLSSVSMSPLASVTVMQPRDNTTFLSVLTMPILSLSRLSISIILLMSVSVSSGTYVASSATRLSMSSILAHSLASPY